jgi:hypothetical protein
MKPLAIVGVLLIVLGIAGLVVPRITFTTEEKVLEVGPIVATAEEEHTLPVPEIAAIAAVIAGAALVFAAQRRRRA